MMKIMIPIEALHVRCSGIIETGRDAAQNIFRLITDIYPGRKRITSINDSPQTQLLHAVVDTVLQTGKPSVTVETSVPERPTQQTIRSIGRV
jgi:hypothetical protein